MTRDLNLPLPVILNPRFLRMKDLVLNQILPPVGRQNDIKSLSSRAKTRDLNLPLLVILNPRFLRMKDLVLNQILPPVGRQNDIKSLSSRVKRSGTSACRRRSGSNGPGPDSSHASGGSE